MRQGHTKLRVNDQVEVISGKDKGRVGKILNIDHGDNRVIVERINIIKKHQKATDPSKSGQIIEKEGKIHVSNIMLVCPECSKTVRVKHKILDDGTKHRVCAACNATVDKSK